ncbi:MAG: type II CRISPR RNA-guided endonuclease Cas9, partial [Muribaculaceae bacterium]|nr:type II CRISPR RNA-guided endonuclease Cas9 [Muribaculaceae bacterium]
MKILGLDLGVGSVGWALIETDADYRPIDILGLGSRILNLSIKESDTFNNGKGETLNAKRTSLRTMRKMNYRFKMRRSLLDRLLAESGMKDSDNDFLGLTPLQLWKLRSDAATEGTRLTLPEIGRVLSHLNKKRGYRHSKNDNDDTTQSQYVKGVNSRYAEIKTLNKTLGQYFYELLAASAQQGEDGKVLGTYRIKDQVFPRRAHEEEFDAIMKVQREFYPNILTGEKIEELRHAIFHQRPLKSCKHLVSLCEFEKRHYKNKNGKIVESGPRVAPRTSPLAQLTRIYEVINYIRIVNPHNKKRKKTNSNPGLFEEIEKTKDFRLLQHEYVLSNEERDRIADFLNTHEKMTSKDLFGLLGLSKSDGFRLDKNIGKGIKGNDTYMKLWNALEGEPERERYLQFNVAFKDVVKENPETRSIEPVVDSETGEILQEVDPNFIEQPLYKLWHTVYSITDKEELSKVVKEKYGFSDEVAERLYAIDFRKDGFSNRSVKFMRKLLPFLMEGYMYSEACTMIGVKHSDYLNKEENEQRELRKFLDPISKNSLRQPTVEKILNQMINIVNALIEKYGTIDEVRVELARPLKMTAEQRALTTERNNKREKENKKISLEFEKYGISPTRRRIQKYQMWEETGCRCMYCGQPVSITEFMGDMATEIEHIIPRSKFFDDSFSNKTFACRKCNQEKGNRTAYDYMSTKSEDDLSAYVERVEEMFAKKIISKTKHDRFLTTESEIPQDFLERDLRQTQYITKKSCELLREVIRNVWVTSGSVTDFFRHAWGYDRILHDLNVERYSIVDKVEEVEYEHAGQIHKRIQIKDWNKRLDHRHHAVDALTAALTRQGYIQRLNKINAEHGSIYEEVMSAGNSHR